MKKTKSMQFIALTFLVLTSQVIAEEHNKYFTALDKDQDGYIDQREMSADRLLTKAAKKCDSNRDGLISKTEFIAYLEKLYLYRP